LKAAEQWGIAPWEVVAGCGRFWWEWFCALENERAKLASEEADAMRRRMPGGR